MKENYYLDNAATTWPKPEPVYQFMDSFFRSHGVNPGRAGHQLAVEAEQMIVQTRRMMAEFFGFKGDPNRVVFTQNITDSLNTVLFGLVNEGDHLITDGLTRATVQAHGCFRVIDCKPGSDPAARATQTTPCADRPGLAAL